MVAKQITCVHYINLTIGHIYPFLHLKENRFTLWKEFTKLILIASVLKWRSDKRHAPPSENLTTKCASNQIFLQFSKKKKIGVMLRYIYMWSVAKNESSRRVFCVACVVCYVLPKNAFIFLGSAINTTYRRRGKKCTISYQFTSILVIVWRIWMGAKNIDTQNRRRKAFFMVNIKMLFPWFSIKKMFVQSPDLEQFNHAIIQIFKMYSLTENMRLQILNPNNYYEISYWQFFPIFENFSFSGCRKKNQLIFYSDASKFKSVWNICKKVCI